MNDEGSTTDSDSREKVETRVRRRASPTRSRNTARAESHLIALVVERDAFRPRRFELRDQRARIEHVAARTLGPLAFHQPHDLHVVEIGEARRLRVEDAEAARAGRRGEGLRAEPSPNRGRQLGDRAGRRRDRDADRRRPGRRARWSPRRGRGGGARCDRDRGGREMRAAVPLARRSAAIRAAAPVRVAAASAACAAGRSAPVQVCDSAAKAIDAAKVALLRHRRVELGHRDAIDLNAFDLESEVRRSQQRHRRAAREVRGGAFEHDIDGGGVGFGGERQGVERFERQARAGKHFAREIEVRQRPRDDQADGRDRLGGRAGLIRLATPSSSSSRSR